MQGPIHTAAEWARIARSTNGKTCGGAIGLTRLSAQPNRASSTNADTAARSKTKRIRQPTAEFVEYRAIPRGDAHTTAQTDVDRPCYLCPCHAEQFAENLRPRLAALHARTISWARVNHAGKTESVGPQVEAVIDGAANPNEAAVSAKRPCAMREASSIRAPER